MLYIDLGGIQNRDGFAINQYYLVRARKLSELNRRDLNDLLWLEPKKVIDLRTYAEIAKHPDKLPQNVEYVHIPIFRDSTLGITHEGKKSIKSVLRDMPDIENLYCTMVTDEYCVSQLSKAIQEIICTEKIPVLFHCTGGRDRTGIVTMLVLSILNVSEEEIIKNYVAAHEISKVRSGVAYSIALCVTRNKEIAKRMKHRIDGDSAFLIAAMNAIKEEFGSMDVYIRDTLGVSDEMKEAFKAKVFEDAEDMYTRYMKGENICP